MKYNQPYGISDPEAPYINGNPSTGTMGSIPPAASIEHPQREIVDIIKRGGLTPDTADLGQLTKSVQQGKINYALATGTPNALIGVLNPVPTLVDGFRLYLRFTVVNTGAMTLDVGDGTGPHPIRHPDNSEMNSYECYPNELALMIYYQGVWQIQVSSQQSTAENLLINPEFQVDQRNTYLGGTSGRTVGAGNFFVDRWRAPSGAGSILISQRNYGIALDAAGSIEQPVEFPNLGGEMVTVCLDSPSVNVLVTLTDLGPNSVTGTITAGQGLRWVSMVVPPAMGPNSNVMCRFTLGSAGEFFRTQLLRGSQPKRFVRRPLRIESLICFGYYWGAGRRSTNEVNVNPVTAAGSNIGQGYCQSATQAFIMMPFPVRMYKTPTLVYQVGSQLSIVGGDSVERPVTNLIAAQGMCRDIGVVTVMCGGGLTAGAPATLMWTSAGQGGSANGTFNYDGEIH